MKTINLTESNKEKSLKLRDILMDRLAKGDKTPIKEIESISISGRVKKFLFNFIPYEFEVTDQAFNGSADSTSYKIEIESNKKGPAHLKGNPVEAEVILFIDRVISFEL